MSDLIRRDDVIATVYNQSDDEGLWSITAKEMENIINSLPSVEPDVPDIHVGNMISQQDAIKAMARAIWHYPNLSLLNNYNIVYELAEDALRRLPSREPEIIRCRDCKHYEFSDNRAFGFPVKRCEWTGFEDVDDSDFCSRAERRTDG